MLEFAGFWFWVLFAVANVLMFCWVEWEWSGWATIVLAAAALALQFGWHIPIAAYVSAHPESMLWGLAGYFGIGTFWSVVKWWFFTHGERRKYNELRAYFLKSNGVSGDVIPDNLKGSFRSKVSYSGIEVKPEVGNHKSRIYIWITYWPWSMLWTIVNDPVRRIVQAIYNRIWSTLQAISDHTWQGTDGDLK